MSTEEDDDDGVDRAPRGNSEVAELRAKHASQQARARKANVRVSELQQQVDELEPKAATVDLLTTRLQELEAKHAADRETWVTERAIVGAGIADPDGIDVARLLHSRTHDDPAKRPDIGEWLAEMQSDPEKMRKPLQPYLTQTQNEPDTAGGGGPQPKRANPNAGITTPPPPGSDRPTSEQLRAAREVAVATGDRTAYDALVQQMGLPGLPKSGRSA